MIESVTTAPAVRPTAWTVRRPDRTTSSPAWKVRRCTPCFGCGYDLRGLEIAGDCPECRRAVRRSIDPTRFDAVDPLWARRVSQGTWLLAAGSLLTGIALLVLPLPGARLTALLTLLAGAGALGLGALGLATLGPHESRRTEALDRTRAIRTRLSITAAALAALAVGITQFPVAVQPLVTALHSTMVLAAVLTWIAASGRVADLMRALADHRPAMRLDRCRIVVGWTIGCALALHIAHGLIGPFAGDPDLRVLQSALAFEAFIVQLLLGVAALGSGAVIAAIALTLEARRPRAAHDPAPAIAEPS